jgi:DNA-binding HxlR family transcriptional regulator
MKRKVTTCPAETTLAVMGGRWKVLILWNLFQGRQRFSDLLRAMDCTSERTITQKTLTQQLRELEADGIVHREIYKQIPPKVEYWLTPV